MVTEFLSLVGLAFVSYFLFQLVQWIYFTFIKKIDLSKYQNDKEKSWALITGSTDGIGLAFAQSLSSQGFNIVLVGRNKEKLEIVKENIEAQGARVIHVISDANDLDSIPKVIDKIKDLNVSVCVNNVGVLPGITKCLIELSNEDVKETVTVNSTYPTLLTKSIIPIMKKHNGKKLIINISSVLGYIPGPFYVVYSATKAYNRLFSLSLSAELANDNFDVLCVSPGLVATKLAGVSENFVYAASAKDCADCSLRKVGLVDVTPCPTHAISSFIMMSLFNLLPSCIQPKAFNFIISLRKRVGEGSNVRRKKE